MVITPIYDIAAIIRDIISHIITALTIGHYLISLILVVNMHGGILVIIIILSVHTWLLHLPAVTLLAVCWFSYEDSTVCHIGCHCLPSYTLGRHCCRHRHTVIAATLSPYHAMSRSLRHENWSIHHYRIISIMVGGLAGVTITITLHCYIEMVLYWHGLSCHTPRWYHYMA